MHPQTKCQRIFVLYNCQHDIHQLFTSNGVIHNILQCQIPLFKGSRPFHYLKVVYHKWSRWKLGDTLKNLVICCWNYPYSIWVFNGKKNVNMCMDYVINLNQNHFVLLHCPCNVIIKNILKNLQQFINNA